MMDSVERQDVTWWRNCFTGRLGMQIAEDEIAAEAAPAD
jgi:hypothetical protein